MPFLKEYSAILFDVDNTLTRTNKELAPATIAMLRELHTTPLRSGVCTGKSYPALKSILQHFPPKSLHILSAGSEIVTNSGDILWQKLIEAETAQKIITELTKNDAKFFVHQSDAVYAAPTVFDYLLHHPYGISVRPITELKHFSRVPYLGIYAGSNQVMEVLKTYSDSVSFRQADHGKQLGFIEVTPLGVNKGVAFMEWCELLAIEPNRVIGLGDSFNDEEFLKYVGLAVVVDNAPLYLKAQADRTIAHTDLDGVATYLQAALLGEPL